MNQASASVTMKLGIPATHPDFMGHFPGFPLLPAVSQIELIKNLVEQHLGLSIECVQVNKAKFKAMLRPNSDVQVELTFTGGSNVRWQIQDDSHVYSMGILQYRPKPA